MILLEIAATIVLFALPVWVLVCLVRFWQKHPSIWQMRRRARKVAHAADAEHQQPRIGEPSTGGYSKPVREDPTCHRSIRRDTMPDLIHILSQQPAGRAILS